MLFNILFDDFLEKNNQLYDTVLFDGHHTYDATINYSEKLLLSNHNQTLWKNISFYAFCRLG